jgi:hypothetical protein
VAALIPGGRPLHDIAPLGPTASVLSEVHPPCLRAGAPIGGYGRAVHVDRWWGHEAVQRGPGETPIPYRYSSGVWALDDPRQRPYLVFWTSPDGSRAFALRVAPADEGTAVTLQDPNGRTCRISVIRPRLPTGTGTSLLYR